mmetsp:Transcript_7056/g.22637  ORF Transcript_7056/g.22637 Transcript_7056/m.22637 type:complete len:205 (-) Transcript_7056:896-1510(-)
MQELAGQRGGGQVHVQRRSGGDSPPTMAGRAGRGNGARQHRLLLPDAGNVLRAGLHAVPHTHWHSTEAPKECPGALQRRGRRPAARTPPHSGMCLPNLAGSWRCPLPLAPGLRLRTAACRRQLHHVQRHLPLQADQPVQLHAAAPHGGGAVQLQRPACELAAPLPAPVERRRRPQDDCTGLQPRSEHERRLPALAGQPELAALL